MSDVLTEVAEGVIVRPMLTLDAAIDLWLGDLARRDYATRTRDTYGRHLDKFADRFPRHWDVSRIGEDDCRGFLAGYNHLADTTRGQVHSALHGLFDWLWRNGKIKRSPMERLLPPRRRRPEDRDVLTVNPSRIPELLDRADTWTQRLSVAFIAYLGPRRRAASNLRRRDYDQDTGGQPRRPRIRLREKGSKTSWKDCPPELADLLDAAIADAVIVEPDDYLIPMIASQRRPGDRDDRIVWKAIRDVADKVGIEAHPHALRRAFAVFYLQRNPNDLDTLREFLGHTSLLTTQLYVRALDRASALYRGAQTISYRGNTADLGIPQTPGFEISSELEAEKEGFEPSMEASPPGKRDCSHPGGNELDEDLLDRVRQSSQQEVEG